MKYFISGHTDLTYDEFIKRYKDRIDRAVSEGASFVIGDAPGVDTYTNMYLSDKWLDLVVYHIGTEPKNNPGNFPTCGGFKNHDDKDAAMTNVSDEDILYIRSIAEQQAIYGEKYKYRVSGTEKNKIRRRYHDIVTYYL